MSILSNPKNATSGTFHLRGLSDFAHPALFSAIGLGVEIGVSTRKRNALDPFFGGKQEFKKLVLVGNGQICG